MLPPYLENESAARTYLESIRWPLGPVCVHCGAGKVYALEKTVHKFHEMAEFNPERYKEFSTEKGFQELRRISPAVAEELARYGLPSSECDLTFVMKRRSVRWGVLKCAACRRQFTVTVGTILQNTHVELGKWLYTIHFMCQKAGVVPSRLCRPLGITDPTARLLVSRIRDSVTPAVCSECKSRTESVSLWPLDPTEVLKTLLRTPPPEHRAGVVASKRRHPKRSKRRSGQR